MHTRIKCPVWLCSLFQPHESRHADYSNVQINDEEAEEDDRIAKQIQKPRIIPEKGKCSDNECVLMLKSTVDASPYMCGGVLSVLSRSRGKTTTSSSWKRGKCSCHGVVPS